MNRTDAILCYVVEGRTFADPERTGVLHAKLGPTIDLEGMVSATYQALGRGRYTVFAWRGDGGPVAWASFVIDGQGRILVAGEVNGTGAVQIDG